MSGLADFTTYAKLITAMPTGLFVRALWDLARARNTGTSVMEMLSALDLIALVAVMVIGLPHGAFDAIAFCPGIRAQPWQNDSDF